MFVIEIFLPLTDNAGVPFPEDYFEAERNTLTAEFGGLTIYARAPANGIWARNAAVVSDEIVIFEVMTSEPDVAWWQAYRRAVEAKFRQEKIVIRSSAISLL